MVNFDEIVSRVKAFKRINSNKDFAVILGLSAPDFSKRKKTGTLLPLIIEWGLSEKVNLDWLLTGEGEPYINKVGEEHRERGDPDDQVGDLLKKTREVLTSKTRFADSLAANIDSFHHAVSMERASKHPPPEETALAGRVEKLEQACDKILEKLDSLENPQCQGEREGKTEEEPGLKKSAAT